MEKVYLIFHNKNILVRDMDFFTLYYDVGSSLEVCDMFHACVKS